MITAIISTPPEVHSLRIPVFRDINKLCDKLEVLVLGKSSKS